jgi:choline dehydrogenase-like flavoprotein
LIYDLEQGTGPEIQRADVCILGAGAAGIMLAVELARAGQRVLLLESGGRREEAESQELYSSEVAGVHHLGIHIGRHRIYGGSTTQWGGQILELFEDDFEAHSWVEGSGWPFSKETLKSYYPRALKLEGLGDATTCDREVWRTVKMTTPDLGPDLIPFFSRYCPERNFAHLFGGDLKVLPNLQVILHANACELLLAEDGETVRGVRSRTLSGKEKIFTADNYVLCMGGIETCRFLLQPHNEGRAPWLENEYLGKNFQDHLAVNSAELVDIHPRLVHSYFDPVSRRGFRYEPRLRLAAKRLEKERLLNVGGMVLFDCHPDDPRHRIWAAMKLAIKGRVREVSRKDLRDLMTHLPLLSRQMYRYQMQGRSYNPIKGTQIRLRVFCEQEPLGKSQITLTSKKDALGQFRAKLDWRISEWELKTIRRFVETVAENFKEKGLARVIPDPDLMEHPEKFVPKIMDSYHHMGGTRMASCPGDGVVDPDLKLHGTRNAYVCSSSVFPASGFSNPTHTLLALTVRLADHLRESAGAMAEVASTAGSRA